MSLAERTCAASTTFVVSTAVTTGIQAKRRQRKTMQRTTDTGTAPIKTSKENHVRTRPAHSHQLARPRTSRIHRRGTCLHWRSTHLHAQNTHHDYPALNEPQSRDADYEVS